ncbi:DNA polymerase nu [Skeletonema marinoi]|uniref:DNA polymerase nu n=1 Tax=Skeletonema marinoi TaxID=267567 RepID=A0AAD8Y919_9STRA|nr:DNA polymerase nu [Skeletonema marinoi]
MMPPSKLSVKSYSAALFGLGNKRGSLLLQPSTSRTAFNNNRSNSIDRRLLATSASWRDRSTAAFITSSSSSSLVPSLTTNGLKKHDNYQFQYNNNLNFFSTAATSTTTSTAIYATVPKADEKHVKAATTSPKASSLGHTNNNKANKQVPTYDYTTIHTIPLTTNFQIKSKPKDGGNWNPTSPLKWCQTFGSRSPEMQQHLSSVIQLKPGDDGYIPPEVYNKEEYPNVTIVRTKEQARIVLEALKKSKLTEPERIHACDTEVMDIDLKNVGPVGNGYVTCLSVYSGPDFDYGLNDQGPGTMLWVDNLDDACGILEEFKEWLEDETVMKIWHNYGFDRHVLWNEGIDVLGLGGYYDTGRMKYSLESLTEDLLGQRKVPMKEIFGEHRLRKDGSEGALVDLPPIERLQRELKSRENFIRYSAFDAKSTYNLYMHLKDRLLTMSWVQDLNLMDYYHMHMRPFGELLTDLERRGMLVAKDYLADVEQQAREDRRGHVQAFRQWAFKYLGADALAMNLASSKQLTTFLFGGSMNMKTKEPTEVENVFKMPRADISDEAMEAYRERDAQLKALPRDDGEVDEPEMDEFDQMKAGELKVLCKEYGLKVSGKKAELQQRLRGHFQLMASSDSTSDSVIDDYKSMSVQDLRDACKARSIETKGKKKNDLIKDLRDDDSFAREISAEIMKNPQKDSSATYRTISELLEEAVDTGENDALKNILAGIREKNAEEPKYVDVTVKSLGMEPDKFTVGGAPSATADVLRKLAGDPFADPPNYGRAYEFFGGGQEGHDACVAFFSLTAIGSIDTMIANFLTSLQTLADHQKRVHCSLNINTETGRLSSRKPNMQNQPALEKDKYKIRQAFKASAGNRLIVADYGQLELRLLASMTDCTSMIEAFEAGGDFHSRTALGMFKYIQDAVENGECLLEWDYGEGEPPKPMLKDLYASERRKAKTLNFSIAYGKTSHGLSQDWGVSQQEADTMLQAWYDSRPEVEKWQKETKATAKKYGLTRTLMGRYRHLPHAKEKNMKMLGHALRASINTPIQGGAADVAMMAMLKINNSELLKKLGWILLMQVHDEVILEGPEETSEEAFEEVLKCMQNPWVLGLDKTKVPLLVDGSCVHDNWYDAK